MCIPKVIQKLVVGVYACEIKFLNHFGYRRTNLFFEKRTAIIRGMEKDIEIHEKEPEGFSPQVQVSACYLEKEGKLLLLQRAANKLEAGKWGVPAGKLEKNELPIDAAVRELFEETGISIGSSQIYSLASLYIRKPEMSYIYHLFKVRIDHLPIVCLSSEHQSYAWASFDELINMPLMAGAKRAVDFYRTFEVNG